MPEITFILEPERGRVTVETSNSDAHTVSEIKQFLGRGTAINCARPPQNTTQRETRNKSASDNETNSSYQESIYLYHLYHYSTVDGPGRRSVVQVAGCSIRCAGCYVPETHEQTNGTLTSIDEIIIEIEKKRGEHDGVTILGGEPFDQPEALEKLVLKLKLKSYHISIYTGYTFEDLQKRESESVNRILANIHLLIDGAFNREFTKNAGEYRGSSNQRLLYYPISRKKR
ncbi:MAG: 4Fe-4S cluster-binding domain-containing protein [Aridibacter sp.]